MQITHYQRLTQSACSPLAARTIRILLTIKGLHSTDAVVKFNCDNNEKLVPSLVI